MAEGFIEVTAAIIAAFVSNNNVRPEEMAGLISDVHARFNDLTASQTAAPPMEKPVPLMPWKKTIHHDYLISLEDGKHYKTLKRHLAVLGLSPDSYREKWTLPNDYPLVCREYSERRSQLAQSRGLGRTPTPQPETVSEPQPVLEAVAPETEKPKAAKMEREVTPILKPKDRKKAKAKAAEGEEELDV